MPRRPFFFAVFDFSYFQRDDTKSTPSICCRQNMFPYNGRLFSARSKHTSILWKPVSDSNEGHAHRAGRSVSLSPNSPATEPTLLPPLFTFLFSLFTRPARFRAAPTCSPRPERSPRGPDDSRRGPPSRPGGRRSGPSAIARRQTRCSSPAPASAARH